MPCTHSWLFVVIRVAFRDVRIRDVRIRDVRIRDVRIRDVRSMLRHY